MVTSARRFKRRDPGPLLAAVGGAVLLGALYLLSLYVVTLCLEWRRDPGTELGDHFGDAWDAFYEYLIPTPEEEYCASDD